MILFFTVWVFWTALSIALFLYAVKTAVEVDDNDYPV